MGVLAAETLSRDRMAPLLRVFAFLGPLPVPQQSAFACRTRLQRLMRLNLARRAIQTAARLDDVEVTLFRSEEHASDEAWDLGWADKCARLRVVPVAGTHHSMFDVLNRRALADQFGEAMGVLGIRAPSP